MTRLLTLPSGIGACHLWPKPAAGVTPIFETSSVVFRLKSEGENLISRRIAKVGKVIRATLHTATRRRDSPTNLGTTLPIADAENRANLCTDEDYKSAARAGRKHQFALSVAARASLSSKLPRWWLWLHEWSSNVPPVTRACSCRDRKLSISRMVWTMGPVRHGGQSGCSLMTSSLLRE